MQENQKPSNDTLISKQNIIHLPLEILYHILSKIPLKERVSVAIAFSLTCMPFYQQLSEALIESENALLKLELKKSAYSLVFWTKMPPSQQPSVQTIFEFLETQFKRAKGQAKVQELMLEITNTTHKAFEILLRKLIRILNINSLIEMDEEAPFFNPENETQNAIFLLYKSVLIYAELTKLDNPELEDRIHQTASEVFRSFNIEPYEAIWGLFIHILLLKEYSSKNLIETFIEKANQKEKLIKRINQAAYGSLLSSAGFYMSEKYILTACFLILAFVLLATTYSDKPQQILREEGLVVFKNLKKILPPMDTDKKEKDEFSSPLSFFNQDKIQKILTEKEPSLEKSKDNHGFEF